MPEKLFDFSIITPEKITYRGKISSLIIPGELGYLGILSDHVPFFTSTIPGKVTFSKENKETETHKIGSPGFLEVLKNNVTLLLSL